jgi:beta-lactamase superfamily II metal-dependent hydrolase
LQFTYGQTTFLMMGDAGADTESTLLASNLLSKVNILKVGHHGSTSGSTSAFLNVIKPDIAIYSASLNNRYGHPAPQTIAALVAAAPKGALPLRGRCREAIPLVRLRDTKID